MSTKRLVTWIAFLSIFAMAMRVSIDTDTWWHLRAGQWIVENRTIPRADPFSYTRLGAAWEYPGWIVQVAMYAIFRLLGPGGLNLWTAIMITGAMVFVWRTMAGGVFLKAFILILAGTVAAVYWAARPYLVTFLLTAAFITVLESFRQEMDEYTPTHWRDMIRQPATRRLLWLPILMILWVNSHGGFITGFIVWGVYFVRECLSILIAIYERKKDLHSRFVMAGPLFGAGILMLLGLGANPFGFQMALYPFKTVSIRALQEYIQEWQSPDFHALHVQPFAWMLLLSMALIGWSKRKPCFEELILTAGFAYMGLMAGRNIALFALAAPMLITRQAEDLLQALPARARRTLAGEGQQSRTSLWINLFALLVILALVAAKIALVFPAHENEKAFMRLFPVGAVKFLSSYRPPTQLFNSYNWGGYLVWALPEYPVFIDGRTDLYDDELIATWIKLYRGDPGWELVTVEYGINTILVERGAGIGNLLRMQKTWREIYRDEQAIIYQRVPDDP